jgi:hypothetical protein
MNSVTRSVPREQDQLISNVIRSVSGSVDEQCNKVSVMLAISAVMLQGKLFFPCDACRKVRN